MPRRMPALLYHGTGILQIAEIIASGYIEVSAEDDYEDSAVIGVSLTSDRDVAQKFAEEAKERDWEGVWNSPVNDAAVICFDTRALENAVSLVPVTWDRSSTEVEIRTRGRIHDPLRFVSRIEADSDGIYWWMDKLAESGEPELAAALLDERLVRLLRAPARKPIWRSQS